MQTDASIVAHLQGPTTHPDSLVCTGYVGLLVPIVRHIDHHVLSQLTVSGLIELMLLCELFDSVHFLCHTMVQHVEIIEEILTSDLGWGVRTDPMCATSHKHGPLRVSWRGEQLREGVCFVKVKTKLVQWLVERRA